MKDSFFVYVTKNALTRGIELREVRGCFDISPSMVRDVELIHTHYHGEDWHRTFESAKSHAEKMRAKKLNSLKNNIAKLEKMTFSEPQSK